MKRNPPRGYDNPFASVLIADSSWFDPDELWGRLLVHGTRACEIASIHENPPPWMPLVEYKPKKGAEATLILNSYGIKLSSNIKTLICLSLTRNLSCRMSRWCEEFCFGKSQNFCRPPTVNALLSNYDAFEFLESADQQAVEDVAWALMHVCTAHNISNLRVPGIGDFIPGLIRVVDAMTAADPGFTVWGFTRRSKLCSQLMPVRDNLVIWSSIDSSMSPKRIQHAIDFAKKHRTGLAYSTEYGIAFQPRDGQNPEPPWWDPPMMPHDNQVMAGIDPFLEDLLKKRKVQVMFGYHGRGVTTHMDVDLTSDMCLEARSGYPECPATDPLGGAHFLGACQECYWCVEKPSKRYYRDLAENRLNKVVTILHGEHRGTRVLLDTGEKV